MSWGTARFSGVIVADDPTERHMRSRADIDPNGRESRSQARHPSFFSRPGARRGKDTNDDHAPIDLEGSARREKEPVSPKRRILATWAGKIFVAFVAATVIMGGAYAVVRLNQPPSPQTGPSVPVGSVTTGCTDLSVRPVSVLVGDGGGDVSFYCGNGSPALTAVNGTASVEVTGVANPSMPIPQGTYSPVFWLYPSTFSGPFGSGHSCSDIPGLWGGIDPRHFGYPITLGTGSWNYCLEYINQTGPGSLNPITVAWTPVADWP